MAVPRQRFGHGIKASKSTRSGLLMILPQLLLLCFLLATKSNEANAVPRTNTFDDLEDLVPDTILPSDFAQHLNEESLGDIARSKSIRSNEVIARTREEKKCRPKCPILLTTKTLQGCIDLCKSEKGHCCGNRLNMDNPDPYTGNGLLSCGE